MKRRIRKESRVALLAATAFISACVPALRTPTGRPEVTIHNATKKQVTDAMVELMLMHGYQVHSVTEYSVVFSKALDSVLAAVLLGSRYDPTPAARVHYAVVDSGGGVRVVATVQAITNPGSAFERVMDLSHGKTGLEFQNLLEELKATLSQKFSTPKVSGVAGGTANQDDFRQAARGFLGIQTREIAPEEVKFYQLPSSQGAVIESVVPGSPAASAGMRPGHIVLEFAGAPIKGGDHLRQLVQQQAPGAEVSLKVLKASGDRETILSIKLSSPPASE